MTAGFIGLIVEAVILFPAAGQFDAYLIGQAQRNFSGLLQPALAHAVLARAGVGCDACFTVLDADDGCPERARDFDLLVAGQRHFLEYLSTAADDGLVGEVAAP